MKTIKFILLMLAILSVSSCEEEHVDGGWMYDIIFLQMDESEELIEAHDYVYDIPAEGGNFTLNIVSIGLYQLSISAACDGISINHSFENPDRVYDAITSPLNNPVYRYIQDISIEAEPNSDELPREFKFCLYTVNMPGKAEITIRQAGK